MKITELAEAENKPVCLYTYKYGTTNHFMI